MLGPEASWSAKVFPIEKKPGRPECPLRCWRYIRAFLPSKRVLNSTMKGEIGLLSSLMWACGKWGKRLVMYRLSEKRLQGSWMSCSAITAASNSLYWADPLESLTVWGGTISSKGYIGRAGSPSISEDAQCLWYGCLRKGGGAL